MSNLIFPMPAPPQGSWAWPVKKSPSYKTLVQTPASNRGENRVSLTPNPIYMFDYDFSYLKGDFQTLSSAIANLMGFYQAVRGASDDWLFQDPYDKSLLAQLLGYGDAVKTQFQIGRTLAFGGFEMMQNVLPTALYINAVSVPAGPQPSGNQWYCGLENWLQFSQALATSPWAQNGGVITAANNAVAAPDGTTTATSLAFPAVPSGFADWQQQVATIQTAGRPFTFSVWLKAASGTVPLALVLQENPYVAVSFSSAITVTTAWQRFSVTGTFPTLSNPGLYAALRYATNATATIYAWGGQLEQWNAPTSYIVTTNSAPVFPRGLATFATAPATTTSVTADLAYYYRCRFLEDEFSDLEEFMFQLWELKSLKFKSLIL